MRTTTFMIFDQVLRGLKRNNETYGVLQGRLSTGKRILSPSDDPAGALRAADYRVEIAGNDQFLRNVDAASLRLRLSDTALSAVAETLTDIRTLIAQGVSGSQDPAIRSGYSTEAAQFRDTLYGLSNSRDENRYLFSGYRTDQQPYSGSPSYLYQGDNGVMNVLIGQNEAVAVNVTGSEVFSYALYAPEVRQLSGGRYAHYTPGAGTAVTVEIRDTDDVTVLQSFSFSNVMQMTDLLAGALGSGDTLRIEALMDPFNKVSTQVLVSQAEIGARLSRIETQTASLRADTVALKNGLSSVEDADPLETAAALSKAEATLQALRESASRVISQSLFDFLD